MVEIYFDGACEPYNPGGTASYGFVIKTDGKVIKEAGGIVGAGDGMTNQVGEYNALIKGLEAFRLLGIEDKEIRIFGDSRLVTAMVSKEWGWNKKKTEWIGHKREPKLDELLKKALHLLEGLTYTISWIPRETNQLADAQSKKVLVEAGAIPADKADNEMCPRCGKRLRLRKGPRGEFWGCTGFPGCRYTEPGKP